MINILKDFPDKKCIFYWYENKLEALLSYNYFKKKYKSLLLWDMSPNPNPQWCVLVKNSKYIGLKRK